MLTVFKAGGNQDRLRAQQKCIVPSNTGAHVHRVNSTDHLRAVWFFLSFTQMHTEGSWLTLSSLNSFKWVIERGSQSTWILSSSMQFVPCWTRSSHPILGVQNPPLFGSYLPLTMHSFPFLTILSILSLNQFSFQKKTGYSTLFGSAYDVFSCVFWQMFILNT